MLRYNCGMCGKLFKRQTNLDYHVNNNVCVKNISDSGEDDIIIHACKYCKKKFTTATSMYRHINHTCKIKKKDDNEKEKIYERLLKLEEDNIYLRKKVVSLEKTALTTKNITNNGNVTNNSIVAHINLIGYGNEDMTKLDKRDIMRAIQQGYNSTIKLTETLHFNPKYPEYHNVYISNMKDKYAMLFDGKIWTLTMKEDLINQIYEDKKNYIEENLEEFIRSLTDSRKNALVRWLETDDDDAKISKIKNEIKLLLYNKRNIVLDRQGKDTKHTKCLKMNDKWICEKKTQRTVLMSLIDVP